jgi:hypothetical protein
MGYIDDSLADNEVLIYRARFHWLHKAGAWLVLIAFLLAAAAAVALVRGVEGVVGALTIALGGLVNVSSSSGVGSGARPTSCSFLRLRRSTCIKARSAEYSISDVWFCMEPA